MMEEKNNSDLEKLMQNLASIQSKSLEEQLKFLQNLGIDYKKINPDLLSKTSNKLVEDATKLKDVVKGKNFKNFRNLNDNLNKKEEKTESDERKLKELGLRATVKEIEEKQQFCFINDVNCNHIINAHSIQENGELSKISDNRKKVLHFVQNMNTREKELEEIDISKASTFKGFCHHHDQLFEAIDKNDCRSDVEEYFLYSFRSFAFSYHNALSFQRHFENLSDTISSSMNSIVPKISELMNQLGLNLPIDIDSLKIEDKTTVQISNSEIIRYEKHRALLIEYSLQKDYKELEFLVYETNQLSPICCSSWMNLHASIDDNYVINQVGEVPYYGIPIIISVLPNDNRTKIILARFKSDPNSELIFKRLHDLHFNPKEFEIEISKLIIENVENFYLSPIFWKNLNPNYQKIILNALSVEKTSFPDMKNDFEMINFFESKNSMYS